MSKKYNLSEKYIFYKQINMTNRKNRITEIIKRIEPYSSL